MSRGVLALIVLCIAFESALSFVRKELPEKLTVYVINLDTKKEKWKRIQELWSEHFNLIRFSARTSSIDPVCGLSLSHIDLMRQFQKQDKEDYLLLMEDDAFPTPDFSAEFVNTAMEHAMRTPFWQVINFGPWFSKQPKVEPVDDYLVTIDYFHTTHFMGYHRRGVDRYVENFSSVIDKGYCLAVDNFFGNYGNAKSMSMILASSKLMAYQKHGGQSDIGGGPEMIPCAINAALAGRMVNVHINEAPRHDIRPTFDPPVYGYRVRGSDEIVWSRQCNLAFDEIDPEQVDRSQLDADSADDAGFDAYAEQLGSKAGVGGSGTGARSSGSKKSKSGGGKKKKKSKKTRSPKQDGGEEL